MQFHEAYLTPDDIADTQDSIQKRVLKFFGRRGWFDKETIDKMLGFENSGFSLDASINKIPTIYSSYFKKKLKLLLSLQFLK
ncbi:MAG: hypothetical protein ACHQUC_03990 [Chlamydiales bacterium]